MQRLEATCPALVASAAGDRGEEAGIWYRLGREGTGGSTCVRLPEKT
jgi:hypothetical protein